MDHASLLEHEEATKVKKVDEIAFGKFRCKTWYYSSYPLGYQDIDTLYICEFCLLFYITPDELKRHHATCPMYTLQHPPGNEIYRHENNSVFEIDGYKNQIYCENLCLMSKLFLDHKTLCYDVEPFLFYILTENDENGCHMVGYFSKEKESLQNYNLACILTLPFHQRKGYGKFLITFSYELSVFEGKPGTPERPLSDMGRESYVSWWTQRIAEFMLKVEEDEEMFTITDVMHETCMLEDDIFYILVN